MARGRMINTTIAEDAEFNELSVEAQLIYLRSIPHLDRDGLINGHPVVLWGKVAPLMQSLLDIMPKVIEELVNSGLVIQYSQGKTSILFFKGFNKNQALTHYDREAPSTFAPPPGYHRTNKGLKPVDGDENNGGATPDKPKKTPPDNEGTTPELVRTLSGVSPELVPLNGMEWNRKEGNARETSSVQVEENLPPVSSSQNGTGDPLMDAAQHRFNRKQQDGSKANRRGAWPEIDKKCSPVQRLPLVEKLIDIHGLRSLINEAGDDSKLADMHQMAADLYAMGYTTTEGIETVYAGWRIDWKNKIPTARQFVQYASTQKDKPLHVEASVQKTANGNTILSQNGGSMIAQGDITRMYQRKAG